jgi:hypothetical protein
MKILLAFILSVSFADSAFGGSAMTAKFDISSYLQRLKQKPEYDRTNDVEYVGANGNTFREFGGPDEFTQYETQKEGPYVIYREFYGNGEPKAERKFAKLGGQRASIGKGYSFDRTGKVTKVEDYEKGFKVDYEQVLEICRKKGIDLGNRLSSLARSNPGETPAWYVEWDSGQMANRAFGRSANPHIHPPGPRKIIKNISIDGVIGEIKEQADHYFEDN